MRVGKHGALIVLFVVAFASRLLAASEHANPVAFPQRLRHALSLSLLPSRGPEPMAVPAADSQGPVVDLSHLDRPARLERELRAALRKPVTSTRLTVPGGEARLGHYSVGSDEVVHGPVLVLEGDAEVHGRVNGNVVALDGDITVFPGGTIAGDVLAIGGGVYTLGDGTITGARQSLASTPDARPSPSVALSMLYHAAGVAGLFLTLAVLGFGLVTFGRPNLEIVSDTVAHSFARSLFVGMLGQVLILPTLGMIVVGLALTIAGALLIPFAAVVFGLVVAVTTLGGLLAAAHAMGERIARRQLARGLVFSPNAYRYVFTGLGALAVLWIAWIIFGWVPVAGVLMLAAAAITTWAIATAGFGAALLSRGGVREHFAGRLIAPEMLTDEYLWATPQFGVPAARRPDPK